MLTKNFRSVMLFHLVLLHTTKSVRSFVSIPESNSLLTTTPEIKFAITYVNYESVLCAA